MWHNHNGGLVVTTSKPGLRIDDGDWSTLTLEAFPPPVGQTAHTPRSVVRRGGSARTQLVLSSDGSGEHRLVISAARATMPPA